MKGRSQTEAVGAVKAMKWTAAKIFSEVFGDKKYLDKLRMVSENSKSVTGIEAAPKKAKIEDAKSQQRKNSTFSS